MAELGLFDVKPVKNVSFRVHFEAEKTPNLRNL